MISIIHTCCTGSIFSNVACSTVTLGHICVKWLTTVSSTSKDSNVRDTYCKITIKQYHLIIKNDDNCLHNYNKQSIKQYKYKNEFKIEF